MDVLFSLIANTVTTAVVKQHKVGAYICWNEITGLEEMIATLMAEHNK